MRRHPARSPRSLGFFVRTLTWADKAAAHPNECEWPLLALLRRKRLVRFDTQVPTFVKQSERAILTLSGRSGVGVYRQCGWSWAGRAVRLGGTPA
jgi:hypothetical protein